MLWIGILVGMGLFAAVVARRCFFRVEQGHLAVLSSFGAALRDTGANEKLKAFGPGLHAKLPWQHVHDVAMMEQSLDLSGEDGGRTAMAADGTILRFDSNLRFELIQDELEAYLFGLRSPIEHMTGLFTCLLRNEIANFRGEDSGPAAGEARALVARSAGDVVPAAADPGSYALIRRERRTLNQRIEQFCRDKIGARYGVRFNAVDLTDILPPDELARALNAVMHARSGVEARRARAESECQQRILAAERGVEIAAARAQAAELEITKIATYLDVLDRDGTLEHYVARRRAEVLGESRTTYLNAGAEA